MKTKQLYWYREKLKRAYRYRDQYQAELDEKLAYVAEHGHWRGLGTVDYPRAKVEKYTAQIAELEAMDLRTDEEKRGYKRKTYTRSKDIVYRGIDDETVAKIERRRKRQHRRMVREQAERERRIATCGTPERQRHYEMRRESLRDRLRLHGRARTLLAEQAIADRHGEDLDLDRFQREAVERYITLLAKLADLDSEYSDCDTSLLYPGWRGSDEYSRPDPYEDD